MRYGQLTPNELERYAYTAGSPTYPLIREFADLKDGAERADDAKVYIDEAKIGLPSEDCLQSLIDEATVMAQGRVTKAEVLGLAAKLSELQDELWRAAEYGMEHLRKAERALDGAQP